MSIPTSGLTIVHGTGLHSATPYDPPSAEWVAEYLASHAAAFDFETLTNPGMPAPYVIHISNATLTLAVTCFHAPGDDQPPGVDPDLHLVALPGDDQPLGVAPDLRLIALPARPTDTQSSDASAATASTFRPANDTASGTPHTNSTVSTS